MRTRTKGRHLKLAKFEMIKANSFKIVRLRAVLKLGAFITQLIKKKCTVAGYRTICRGDGRRGSWTNKPAHFILAWLMIPVDRAP